MKRGSLLVLGIIGVLVISGCTQTGQIVKGNVLYCEECPIEMEIYSEYDSCSITLRKTDDGLPVVQGSVEGLEFFNKRGAIIDLGFELKSGRLQEGDYKIEAEVYNSTGGVVWVNTGTFNKDGLIKDSECDMCYSVLNFTQGSIPLPYEEDGNIKITITAPDEKEFSKTIQVNQAECLIKTITSVFNDLFECIDSNKTKGDNCECFNNNECLSHQATNGNHYLNPDAEITLVNGDRIEKQQIINTLNRENFDFRFTKIPGPLAEYYSCDENILSANTQVSLYLIARYNPNSSNYDEYGLWCYEK